MPHSPCRGGGGVGVLTFVLCLSGPACRWPLFAGCLSVSGRQAGGCQQEASGFSQAMAHLASGAGFSTAPPPPTPAFLALQDYSLGDSVGDPGDRRERSSGLQILNQGQSEEKSEGLRGRGQSPRESPRPAQGTRGSGWGRGWRAQSSLEEHLPQEGLNNETPQLLTEPLSEGCL